MKIFSDNLCLLTLLYVTLALQSPSFTQAQPAVPSALAASAVAMVSQGEGTGYKGSKAILLRPSALVYPGWKLICRPASKMLVVVFNDNTKVTLKPGEKPYRVPYIEAHSGQLDAVLVPAGRNQSLGGNVFSPSQDGHVWPSRLVFQWTPLPKGTILKLILRRSPVQIGDNTPLWAKAITEDGSGSYQSAEARDALIQLRGEDPDAKAQLTLVASDEQNSSVVFGVLSVAEETHLQQELSASDADDPLLRRVERSSVFLHYRLYSEAANEMEQALLLSPDSTQLRIAVLWADRRSGNLAREEYHRKHLPPGSLLLEE